jgi:hypothetical protein
MKPLYVTKHFSEPGMRDYYTSRVYIRMPLNDTNGWRYRSSHHSTAHFSTDDAAVNDAARRALWSICNAKRAQLFNSEYRHVPRRASGTEETVVPVGGDDRIDILARVTAALNTDLEGATTEMNRYHEELQAAQVKIARLEAQLAGQRLPQEVMPYHTTASPPHKRDSVTAPLKLLLILARILGYSHLPFTFSLDRSCVNVLLVIMDVDCKHG